MGPVKLRSQARQTDHSTKNEVGLGVQSHESAFLLIATYATPKIA